MISLKDRVAIVAGSSSGIGAEIARALAREGMTVVLAARRADKLAEVVADIEADGGRALAVTADLTVETDVEGLFNAAVMEFGAIDLAVSCAGKPQNTPVEQMGLAE